MTDSNDKYSKVYAVPRFQFGDLIQSPGYGNATLRVEGYTIEAYRSHVQENNFDEIIYDCTIIGTGELAIAEQEGAVLLADASQADDYIQANMGDINKNATPLFIMFQDPFENESEVGDMPKKQSKPTHRDREKAEIQRRKDYRKKIDVMLADYNRYKEEGKDAEAAGVMAAMKVEGIIFKAGGYTEEEE